MLSLLFTVVCQDWWVVTNTSQQPRVSRTVRFKSSCFNEFQFVNKKSKQAFHKEFVSVWHCGWRQLSVKGWGPGMSMFFQHRQSYAAEEWPCHKFQPHSPGKHQWHCFFVFSFLKTAIALSSDRMWSFIGCFEYNLHQLNSKGLLGRSHFRYFLCVTLQKMTENAFTFKSLALSTHSHILWFLSTSNLYLQ